MKDKILSIFSVVVMFGSFAYIGFRCTQLSMEKSNEFPMLALIIALLFTYVFFLLHIILHELGHLVAGLITGYEFVSFRIGSIVWIKDKEGKIKLKKSKVKGTAGQCLMFPPKIDVEQCPYKLYHMMGGITNLVFGAIGIIVAIFTPHNIITFLFFEVSGVIGISLGLTNLIPCKNNGMQNDGYNLMDLKNNKTAKMCMNLVLSVNALLTVADSYNDLPDEIVTELKSIDFKKLDISNASIANAFVFQVALLFAEGQYEDAYKLYKYIAEYPDMLPLFKNEANCECLFYEIISGEDKEVIEKRYTKELKKYIQATMIYPSRQRLMYAFYKLYEKDEAKAEECKRKLEKMVDTFVIKADVINELAVVNKII